MTRSPVLAEAEFDPKLRTYLYVTSLWVLAISVIGIALIPVWLFAGIWWSRRSFEALSCVLTERALVLKKGVLFRSEKTIPLDSIQDLALNEGPLLRRLGLAQIKIETAGQSAAQGSSEGSLVGVVDSIAFRDRILEQRDHVAGHRSEAARPISEVTSEELLVDIRDSLERIERHLAQSNDRALNAP